MSPGDAMPRPYHAHPRDTAADGGQVTALCLLDLTAAFDTVDHDLLVLRLERHFGIQLITALHGMQG